MPSRSNAIRATRAALPSRGAGGGTLLGVFIGLVLGIALAATVGLYVTGGWKAYQQQVGGSRDAKDGGRGEPVKSAKNDAGDKPRFDFYKILPSGEEAKAPSGKPATSDRSLADQAAQAPSGKAAPPASDKDRPTEASGAAGPGGPPKSGADRFWLQAGSFASEPDAENLRARLALAGWEAQLQQGTLPDKATRYRVRLGPYDNVAELNRIKGELARRGFDVAVIKY